MKPMCFIHNLADAFFLYIFFYIKKYTSSLRLWWFSNFSLFFYICFISTQRIFLTSILLLVKQLFQYFPWKAVLYRTNSVKLTVGIYCKASPFKARILFPSLENNTFDTFLLMVTVFIINSWWLVNSQELGHIALGITMPLLTLLKFK